MHVSALMPSVWGASRELTESGPLVLGGLIGSLAPPAFRGYVDMPRDVELGGTEALRR